MNFRNPNQESLEDFIQLVSQDPQLQQKLQAACDLATTDSEAALRSIVELGKEKGYSFSSLEVAERLNVITEEPEDPLSELSEWELEAVAGGIGVQSGVSLQNCCSNGNCTDGQLCRNNIYAGQSNFCYRG